MAPTSRNRRVGEALAQGLTVEEAVAKLGQVAEGVKTAPTVMDLAREYASTCRLPRRSRPSSVVAKVPATHIADFRRLPRAASTKWREEDLQVSSDLARYL